MKKISLALSVLAIAVTISSCSKSDNGPSTTSQVMIVNGCVLATDISVKANGVQITNASSIPFTTSSGYQSVTAGSSVAFTYYLTNPVTLLATQSENMVAGSSYTLFAGNSLVASPSVLFTTDDLTAPASGYAKIRFVNLSSDTLSETAYVGDSTFASGITTTMASPFYSVAAGSYSIKAGDPRNLSTVVSTSSTLLAAGKIYTFMLTGNQSGSGTSGLTLTIINNN